MEKKNQFRILLHNVLWISIQFVVVQKLLNIISIGTYGFYVNWSISNQTIPHYRHSVFHLSRPHFVADRSNSRSCEYTTCNECWHICRRKWWFEKKAVCLCSLSPKAAGKTSICASERDRERNVLLTIDRAIITSLPALS